MDVHKDDCLIFVAFCLSMSIESLNSRITLLAVLLALILT